MRRPIKITLWVVGAIFAAFVLTHAVLLVVTIGGHVGDFGAVSASAVNNLHGTVGALGAFGALALFVRAYSLGGGTYFAPTVLDEVPESARVVREEPFGPVAPILRFSDLDDAVRIANATPYGLQAAVYTRDLARGFRLAKQIRAGGVHLNDPTNLRWDALPFGGIKESGLGREGLRYAMEEMTEVKLISVNFAGD